MRIVFDPAKDAANIAKHGLWLADFTGFDDQPSVIVDGRRNYGETRFQARGRLGGKGSAPYMPKPMTASA